MTLEEAIEHCKEVALQENNNACSLQHRQLLSWLIELKELRRKNCGHCPVKIKHSKL